MSSGFCSLAHFKCKWHNNIQLEGRSHKKVGLFAYFFTDISQSLEQYLTYSTVKYLLSTVLSTLWN